MDTLIKTETSTLKSLAEIIERYRWSLDFVGNESSKLSVESQIELAWVRRHLRIEHDAMPSPSNWPSAPRCLAKTRRCLVSHDLAIFIGGLLVGAFIGVVSALMVADDDTGEVLP